MLLDRIQFAKQSSGRRPEIAIREFTGNVGVIEDSSCVGNTNQNSTKMSSMSSHRGQTFWRQHVMVKFFAAYRDELEGKKMILQDPSEAINFQTVVLTNTNDFVVIA